MQVEDTAGAVSSPSNPAAEYRPRLDAVGESEAALRYYG